MNTSGESNTRFDMDTDNAEQVLHDFMLKNFEQDPVWFQEPENTLDYGPPGMPTPWVPSDPRITQRQQRISDSLRELLEADRLPESFDSQMIEMLQLNFDSFNTILGSSNNDSYMRWKMNGLDEGLSLEMRDIEERGVLGLASQKEIAYFLRNTEGLVSSEFWRIFHPFMYRMRHLAYRRVETDTMILDSGGEIYDNADGSRYYGLKLYPYVVESHRDLTQEEVREIALLQSSIMKKWEALHAYVNENNGKTIKTQDSLMQDEIYNAVSDAIDQEEKKILSIQESTQIHRTEGLLASIKRHVGTMPKSDDKSIKVVERQLFAVDISKQKDSPEFQEIMRQIRLGEKPNEKMTQFIENIELQFVGHGETVIPISTTAFGFEVPNTSVAYTSVSSALAKVATGHTTRMRR